MAGPADDQAYIAEVRAAGQGKSEDYARFSDAELLAWRPYYQGGGKFKNNYGDIVDKPDERGPNTPRNRNGTGDQGDFGWGWNAEGLEDGTPPGGGGGGGGGYGGGTGGVPIFNWERFQAPSYEEAMRDPGYQFALKQGTDALQGSAAAKGTLRTSGTLKDLMQYGQGMAAQQYGDVYNRALQTAGFNYQGMKDAYAPQYGAWQTGQANDLSRWTTQYGGDLSRYLNRENNIFGLLNQPAPQF